MSSRDLTDTSAREQESVLVLGKLILQPLGRRGGSDKDEKAPTIRVDLLPAAVPDFDALEPIFAEQRGDLRLVWDDNLRVLLDLVDQVPRHGGVKRIPAEMT